VKLLVDQHQLLDIARCNPLSATFQNICQMLNLIPRRVISRKSSAKCLVKEPHRRLIAWIRLWLLIFPFTLTNQPHLKIFFTDDLLPLLASS
jgi:hypothetical protein